MPDAQNYDALLLVSFGGPERAEDVMPFLRRVVAGRGVPDERLAKVAEHYYALGGKSPINDQCRALIEALRVELREAGITLPIYWGNRNWDPLLEDTLRQMRDDGIERALAFVTSAFSSYSGCRQYREAIERARQAVGEGAPVVHKLRGFYDHPRFEQAVVERAQVALSRFQSAAGVRLVFTAHSIPSAMAEGCAYETQLRDAAARVAERLGFDAHELVYQSRSGPPQVPWLEPDVLDHLSALHAQKVDRVLLVPIGFVSDHMEVVWDLDHEAKDVCAELGIELQRAQTAGVHPEFVAMVRELVQERLTGTERRSLSAIGPLPDICPTNCCVYTPRRPGPPARP